MAEEKVKSGRGWRGDPEGHAVAGQKGGQTLVAKRGRKYMSALGQKGGLAVSADKNHMSAIGRKGGQK
jgi:uncharacterized protein